MRWSDELPSLLAFNNADFDVGEGLIRLVGIDGKGFTVSLSGHTHSSPEYVTRIYPASGMPDKVQVLGIAGGHSATMEPTRA